MGGRPSHCCSCVAWSGCDGDIPPEGITGLCERFGLIPGAALDLANGWDLSTAEHREMTWRRLIMDKPRVLIGSPPCTLFTMLQNLNWARYGKDRDWRDTVRHALEQAKAHVDVCCEVYQHQLQRGAHVLHEQQWSASSWRLWKIDQRVADPSVYLVHSDQGRLGLVVPDQDGHLKPAKKTTGIADELNKECSNDREHQVLLGGRAAACAVYPPGLCRPSCIGMSRQHGRGRYQYYCIHSYDKHVRCAASLRGRMV